MAITWQQRSLRAYRLIEEEPYGINDHELAPKILELAAQQDRAKGKKSQSVTE